MNLFSRQLITNRRQTDGCSRGTEEADIIKPCVESERENFFQKRDKITRICYSNVTIRTTPSASHQL